MTRTNAPDVEGRQRLAIQMKARRRAMGISQEAFADLIGLDRTYVSSIERCRRNVSIDNIGKIARGFGVDIVDMLKPLQE